MGLHQTQFIFLVFCCVTQCEIKVMFSPLGVKLHKMWKSEVIFPALDAQKCTDSASLSRHLINHTSVNQRLKICSFRIWLIKLHLYFRISTGKVTLLKYHNVSCSAKEIVQLASNSNLLLYICHMWNIEGVKYMDSGKLKINNNAYIVSLSVIYAYLNAF